MLRIPYGRFTYEVTGHRVVPADYGQAFSAGSGGTGNGGAAGSGGQRPYYNGRGTHATPYPGQTGRTHTGPAQTPSGTGRSGSGAGR